jgi:alpha-galactosidase
MIKFIFCNIVLAAFFLNPVIGQSFTEITATTSPKGWILHTQSSAYQIVITANGKVKNVFYGPAEQADFLQRNARWTESMDEVPVRGSYPFKTPAVEVIFKDNVRDADLRFIKGEVVTIDSRPTLKLTQRDSIYPFEVVSFIRVLKEYDILEKWMVVTNLDKKGNIRIENLQSGSISLPADQYMLTHMAGAPENEFQTQETLLTAGVKTIQNKTFKSVFNAPWFLVRPKNADPENGYAWFGSFHYSGNWIFSFDQTFNGNLEIVGGINFWDTWWNLEPGKPLQTPKFSVGFTKKGSDGAAQSLSAYVRNVILPPVHRKDLRPLLYNSWFATFYDVNEDQQLALAKVAKEVGAEMFVIDDGWFKGRVKSDSGLGDWEVDKIKFPNGLGPLIKKINDMGMDFGIWVEPENVVRKSEIYRLHPDWTLDFPNRKGVNYRLFLNLAKEEVYQYLLQSLTKLLKENNIKFIKWDQNTYLSEPGWPDADAATQREVRIRFINNLYRLIDELKARFPNVWFESCASGGGRVDLGMLSRMDQAWVSDNVDPLDRIFMHYEYLNALPANTMVSWVTDPVKHQPISLDYKFDVSMAGVLGIGSNITKWTTEERATARKKVAQYKIIRPLIQMGKVSRLVNPNETNRCAIQYSNARSDSSAVICYNMAEYLAGSQFIVRGSSTLKLKDLKPDVIYRVQKIEEAGTGAGTNYKGDFLRDIGIAWPVKGANKSQVLLISETNTR